MNPTPLARLLSRRVCTCSPTLTSNFARQISTAPPLRSRTRTVEASSYGSPETLKRKFQYQQASAEGTKTDQRVLKERMRNSILGIVACTVGVALTIYYYPIESTQVKVTKNDAPPSIPGIPDTSIKEEVEQVPTGTSTIPTFPKSIHLSELASPADASEVDRGEQEYQLVGLGIRTVSFLSIQVYVVGMYIALPDVAKLQERLVRVIDPVATTLVANEKSQLKDMLLDKEKSEEIWNDVLKDGGIRTVFRIVPIRNTDFLHLRDGWIRGITAKTQHFTQHRKDNSFSDETFGAALNEFKTVIGGQLRKKIPYGETILLTRDGQGALNSWYEDKKGVKVNLGQVNDERISRLVWLLYLGGANVSSEPLRKNVVDGIMEYVERPVGTVATQVV